MWSFNGLIVYSSALLFAAFTTSESEWLCMSDRKSVTLMHWSADRPNLLYTSSAKRHATFICRPTRIKIVSNSMRLRCDDWLCELVALVSSVIALLSKLFHSWNRLFDRFSKSKWSGGHENCYGLPHGDVFMIFDFDFDFVFICFFFWVRFISRDREKKDGLLVLKLILVNWYDILNCCMLNLYPFIYIYYFSKRTTDGYGSH